MSETILKNAKILIVDDEPTNVRFLEIILQEAGYSTLCSTTDAREAVSLFQDFQPDIILFKRHVQLLKACKERRFLTFKERQSRSLLDACGRAFPDCQ